MVPFIMPSVLCDAHTGANNITIPKETCVTLFKSLSPNEQNGAIDDAVSSTWWQCWYQWHYMTEKVMFNLILIIVT